MTESIRKLPELAERVETGPVQFGDDWPGVFIRGDSAAYYALMIDNLLRNPPADADALTLGVVGALRDLLARAIVGPSADLFRKPAEPSVPSVPLKPVIIGPDSRPLPPAEPTPTLPGPVPSRRANGLRGEGGRGMSERQPCPDGANMGEYACGDRSQCWEPCGELGKSAQHAQPASKRPAHGCPGYAYHLKRVFWAFLSAWCDLGWLARDWLDEVGDCAREVWRVFNRSMEIVLALIFPLLAVFAPLLALIPLYLDAKRARERRR